MNYNYQTGITLQNNTTYNIIFGNQVNNTNAYGIYFSVGCHHNIIIGNEANNSVNDCGIFIYDSNNNLIANNKAMNNYTYGIRIYDSASTENLILGNDLTGNTSGAIQNNGTNTIIKDNKGYNPVGVSTITVGASPFTYTAGASPETVYIRGGTVSDISKGGQTLFTDTNHSVELEPYESVTVTYSVAPTMIKDVH